jgi:hypothetical protein
MEPPFWAAPIALSTDDMEPRSLPGYRTKKNATSYIMAHLSKQICLNSTSIGLVRILSLKFVQHLNRTPLQEILNPPLRYS